MSRSLSWRPLLDAISLLLNGHRGSEKKRQRERKREREWERERERERENFGACRTCRFMFIFMIADCQVRWTIIVRSSGHCVVTGSVRSNARRVKPDRDKDEHYYIIFWYDPEAYAKAGIIPDYVERCHQITKTKSYLYRNHFIIFFFH